ncbi:hypothetical protein NE237_027747 [Protea cynaroides]|uniref:Uncharacterized protein n=1 Tax=Protea cynaroides TaxID=273540 RepID=A0A9Q0JUH7_9MAGN|nr:hypothetical protein NE237_027747 [Protea cynaroides]
MPWRRGYGGGRSRRRFGRGYGAGKGDQQKPQQAPPAHEVTRDVKEDVVEVITVTCAKEVAKEVKFHSRPFDSPVPEYTELRGRYLRGPRCKGVLEPFEAIRKARNLTSLKWMDLGLIVLPSRENPGRAGRYARRSSRSGAGWSTIRDQCMYEP